MKIFNELQKLYEEKEQNNLVIFVGAGISEHYSESEDGKKYPSWSQLVNGLILEDKDKNKDKIDFPKIAQLYENNKGREHLIEKIKDIFPKKSNFKNKDSKDCIHKLIFEVEPAHIITTNYDTLLEEAMSIKNHNAKYHVVNTDKSIPYSNSKQNFLIKAHGDLNEENIVLTEQDYNNYEKNFPLILSFIRYIFSKYRVLFIGFSLSDPNFNKILSWVKNILEETSIEHSVILNSDISKSERIDFENKSVNVITSKDIINELLNKTSKEEEKETYLAESLKFIKNGFPSQRYTAEQRLDVLKENLKGLNYFRYLLPEMIDSFLENTYLKFHYESRTEIIIFINKKEKEIRYPWISNIIQYTSSHTRKDKLDLFKLFNGDSQVINIDKDFKEVYFNDIGKMLLSSNIFSLGNLEHTEDQLYILDLLDIDSNEVEYLLTYNYKKTNEGEELVEYDKSFNENSPYYKELTFNSECFYSNYLIGDKGDSFNKYKEIEYGDELEEYFKDFRLYHLSKSIKSEFRGFDITSYNNYGDIFKNMTKHNQKVFKHIHDLEFIENYFDFITDLEKDYDEVKDKMNNYLEFKNKWNLQTRYLKCFYINYSRFLKFVILNKLPIIEDKKFQKAIHKSNMFYFNNFMKNNDDGKPVEIYNWFIIGFLLDIKKKDFVSEVINNHLKYIDNPFNLVFQKKYIKDLFNSNIKNLDNTGNLQFSNILYILSLSTMNKSNYIFILDLFFIIIKEDIKYIENFIEALRISHINFMKNNKIDKEIKSKLSLILNLYIEDKLNYEKENYEDINDNKFSEFVFDLNIDINETNKSIKKKLKLNIEDISRANLNSFIVLLKIMGYKKEDIQNLIDTINTIEKKFIIEKIYSTENIENAIVKLYNNYNIDLGINRIEKHYFDLLTSDSNNINKSIVWLLFLFDNNCLSSNIISKLKEKNIENIFIEKLNSIIPYFDNYKITLNNGLIELLIKIDNFSTIEDFFYNLKKVKNSEYFLKLIIYLINRFNMLKLYKKDIIKLLELIEEGAYKSIFLSVKVILINSEGIDNKELKSILNDILENKKDRLN